MLGIASGLVSTGAGVALWLLVLEVDKAQVALDAEQRAARVPEVSKYREALGPAFPADLTEMVLDPRW